MSGGTFNYCQNRMEWEIAQPLQKEILKNNVPYDWPGADEYWEGYRWKDDTIREFKNGLEALRKAYVYIQRIDWLLASDDSEETFHERLAHDLENFKFDLPTEVDDGEV